MANLQIGLHTDVRTARPTIATAIIATTTTTTKARANIKASTTPILQQTNFTQRFKPVTATTTNTVRVGKTQAQLHPSHMTWLDSTAQDQQHQQLHHYHQQQHPTIIIGSHQQQQQQKQQKQQQHPHRQQQKRQQRNLRTNGKHNYSTPHLRLSSRYILQTDSMLIMMTLLVVATVVISENAVFAVQRESFKHKDSKSISNNGNTVLNAIDGNVDVDGSSSAGDGRGSADSKGNTNGISNGNINTHAQGGQGINDKDMTAGMMSEGATGSSSGAHSFQTSVTSMTTTTKTTTTAKTTTLNSGGGGSNILQKSNSFTSGISGINRNTIEMFEDSRSGPYFDKSASKNVTALLGKTAYLNCRVKNLGNKTMLLQVSWVRHRDIHLLTVGRYTYTSDQRFRAIHQPQTEDWILQIKYPQHRDSGVYECQVSSTPHISHYIHLNVVEPSTEIIGAPDLYIESGSTINLTCVILNSPEPPAYIFWNHNSAIINYDSPRGGVSIVTNKGETTTSFLLIKSARPSDSGHYQCNPSNAKPKSVTVHVLNGEFPAAMQRAGLALHRMSPSQYCLVYLLVYLCTFAYAGRYMQLPQGAATAPILN